MPKSLSRGKLLARLGAYTGALYNAREKIDQLKEELDIFQQQKVMLSRTIEAREADIKLLNLEITRLTAENKKLKSLRRKSW